MTGSYILLLALHNPTINPTRFITTWEDTETNCVADACVRLSVNTLCVGGVLTHSDVEFLKRTVPSIQVYDHGHYDLGHVVLIQVCR